MGISSRVVVDGLRKGTGKTIEGVNVSSFEVNNGESSMKVTSAEIKKRCNEGE